MPYLSSPFSSCRDTHHSLLPHAGIEQIHELPTGLTKYEEDAIKAAMPELDASIKKGVEFAQQS